MNKFWEDGNVWIGPSLVLVNHLTNLKKKKIIMTDTRTLKRVCSLQTKQECWTYDGQILLVNWQVALMGRENKLPIFK